MRNALVVHVAGENHVHSGVGKLLGEAIMICHKIRALQIVVGHLAMMLHADNLVAALFGGFNLLEDPFLQVWCDLAAALCYVLAALGVVRAVSPIIHGNDGVAWFRPGHVGLLTCHGAILRDVAGNDRRILIRYLIIGTELLRGNARSARHRRVPLGVDVVVAVDDIDMHSRDRLLQSLQPAGELGMAQLLAVFGEITGDEEDLGLQLLDLLQRGRNNGLVMPVVLDIGAKIFPAEFGVGHKLPGENVDIGEAHDPQILVCLLRLFLCRRSRDGCEDDHQQCHKARQPFFTIHKINTPFRRTILEKECYTCMHFSVKFRRVCC